MAATAPRIDPQAQAVRDQEVLRANRELAAYFRGLRTEREARAALKIIKAYIRDRERQDPGSQLPLPGAPGQRARKKEAAAAKNAKKKKAAPRRRPKAQRRALQEVESVATSAGDDSQS